MFKLCEFFIPTVYRKAVDEQSYSGVTPKEAVREFRQFYYNCTAASLVKWAQVGCAEWRGSIGNGA